MIEQGSQAWHEERCGKITASRMKDVLAAVWFPEPLGRTPKQLDELAGHLDVGRGYGADDALLNAASQELNALRAVAKKPKERDAMDTPKLDEFQHLMVANAAPQVKPCEYLDALVAERVYGKVIDTFTNYAMKWGHDQEPNARLALGRKLGLLIEEVGFVEDLENFNLGASVDGFTTSSTIEIKCPLNPQRHLRCFSTGMPEEHDAQVQGQLMVTCKPYAIFCSYDPRAPEGLQVYWEKVDRDEEYIEKLRRACYAFDAAVEDKVADLFAAAQELNNEEIAA